MVDYKRIRAAFLLLLTWTSFFPPAVGFIPLHHPSIHRQVRGEPSILRRNLFTGAIEETGTIVSMEERDDLVMKDGNKVKGTELTVQGDVVMNGAFSGLSICVSGLRLTATEFDADESTFKVGISADILRRTYLGSLNPGDEVNLERASEIGGRNTGHFVQGHVDGYGKVMDKWTEEGNRLVFQIQVPPGDIINYMIPKGFVAIDGTSLTVLDVDVDESWFTFELERHQQDNIIIPSKQIGDSVNIEVDVLGKYSEKAVKALLPRVEELESQYEDLRSKTHELEAISKGLMHKVQSLESARLLGNGVQNYIPDARMVSGPEAARVNNEWRQQQEQGLKKHYDDIDSVRGMRNAEVLRADAPAPRQEQQRPQQPPKQSQHRAPQQNNGQKKKHVIRGPEAARINDEWRRQQEQLRGQYKVKRIDEDNLPFAGVGQRQFNNQQGRKKVVGGPDARRIQDEWLRSQGKTMFEKEMMKESKIQDAEKIIDVGDKDPYMGVSPDQDKQNTEALIDEFEMYAAPESVSQQLGVDANNGAADDVPFHKSPAAKEAPFQVPFEKNNDFGEQGINVNDSELARHRIGGPARRQKRGGPQQPLRDARVVDDERWNQQPNQYNDPPPPRVATPPPSFWDSQQPSGRPPRQFNRQPADPNHMANDQYWNQPPGHYAGQDSRRLFERPPTEHFGRDEMAEQHYDPTNPYFDSMGEFADPWYDQSGQNFVDQSGRNPDLGGAGLYGPDGYRQDTRYTKEVMVSLDPDNGLLVDGVEDDYPPPTRAVHHDEWPQTFNITPDKNW